MDWVNERFVNLWRYIHNLSFRKAMTAYVLLLAVVVWGLSYITMAVCRHWELAAEFHAHTEVLCRVLRYVRVWCPFLYAFAGMILLIFLFYDRRLKTPLLILEKSMKKIKENDLDFQVEYESLDEMGRLCGSFDEMRRELVRDKEELWRLVERQKELNAAFAHDLRTPLTVLKGYTDFLARYIPEGKVSKEKMQDTLALMADHLKRLEEYSRTMKGVQSIEEIPFSPENTELESIQKKIEEIIFALNQIGDIQIQCKVCGENQKLALDDNLFTEVLENLLSNAIRYARTSIEVYVDYKNNELLLTVRDDGPGFSSEQKEKALKPYYQEYKGEAGSEHFGIGLHISRELCRRHGGTLSIADSIHGGAVVTASFKLGTG